MCPAETWKKGEFWCRLAGKGLIFKKDFRVGSEPYWGGKFQGPSAKEQPGGDSRRQDARLEEQPMLRAQRWLIHHPKPDLPFRSFRDFRCYPTPSTFPCIPWFSSAAGSGRRKLARLRHPFSCLHSSANLWHPSLIGAFAGSSKGQVPKNGALGKSGARIKRGGLLDSRVGIGGGSGPYGTPVGFNRVRLPRPGVALERATPGYDTYVE